MAHARFRTVGCMRLLPFFYAMEEVRSLHGRGDDVVPKALDTLRRIDDPLVELLKGRLVRAAKTEE